VALFFIAQGEKFSTHLFRLRREKNTNLEIISYSLIGVIG
jgi:hypothetical protein